MQLVRDRQEQAEWRERNRVAQWVTAQRAELCHAFSPGDDDESPVCRACGGNVTRPVR